eukprot:TRINITY_DN27100_c0_g1_i1.p1 TRINITY_DN27100_c0_g1~~TRINITY_DN27100_c0_g1_i1.p1  ORF type:complete len:395 (+),score=143.72 TRINITY_DN27100_c0_g1_i1:128-1312(+)
MAAVKFLAYCSVPVLLSLGLISFRLEDLRTRYQLAALAALSVLAFYTTLRLIDPVSKLCLKAGLHGIDINKAGSEERSDKNKPIPESLGLVSAVVYLTAVCMFQPVFQSADKLGAFNGAVISIAFITLLGFADDVLDLRWSYKVAVSFLATVPALVAYSATGGLTYVVVPRPLVPLLSSLIGPGPPVIDLGPVYYVILALLAVFMTNSINILAGVNGLEVGQSMLIALAFLLHCSLQVGVYNAPAEPYLLAFYLLVPFVAVSAALLWWNWYPSRVFVGDAYTYFAGMTFAVTAMLGHSSKTMMLFFAPQLLNFALSLPQLIGIVPCPRHRLPRLNKTTGLLEAVPSHLNLLNQLLRLTGPTSERQLCINVLWVQTALIVVAFWLRYYVADYLYN